ncbi:hypothetical protein Q3G72_021137 [Acer saccharum]|nr:hypothetical protein Q3G72_021137 [Acer saccharum]
MPFFSLYYTTHIFYNIKAVLQKSSISRSAVLCRRDSKVVGVLGVFSQSRSKSDLVAEIVLSLLLSLTSDHCASLLRRLSPIVVAVLHFFSSSSAFQENSIGGAAESVEIHNRRFGAAIMIIGVVLLVGSMMFSNKRVSSTVLLPRTLNR